MAGYQVRNHPVLDRQGRGHPVTDVRFCHGAGHPVGLGQAHPHLDAVGRSDPALGLDLLPGSVVALGPDEGEDVVLVAVLAHQSGRQPHPTACL